MSKQHSQTPDVTLRKRKMHTNYMNLNSQLSRDQSDTNALTKADSNFKSQRSSLHRLKVLTSHSTDTRTTGNAFKRAKQNIQSPYKQDTDNSPEPTKKHGSIDEIMP